MNRINQLMENMMPSKNCPKGYIMMKGVCRQDNNEMKHALMSAPPNNSGTRGHHGNNCDWDECYAPFIGCYPCYGPGGPGFVPYGSGMAQGGSKGWETGGRIKRHQPRRRHGAVNARGARTLYQGNGNSTEAYVLCTRMSDGYTSVNYCDDSGNGGYICPSCGDYTHAELVE